MLTRIRRPDGRPDRRRGVTLVEMLVVVALVVLMMTILVQIFQQATGAISISRTTADLDVNLRQLDSIIRSDLAGTTAKMTPPNDPKDKRGYFEYGENARADAQGEDTDDYMAFTTKAAEGEVFTGRQWINSTTQVDNQRIQPTTITSQVAEVIYFLRNGNLYRRVFLVVPERTKSITTGKLTFGGYETAMFGLKADGTPRKVSWQGMNDISCRPNNIYGIFTPIPNDLGSLTNRENRRFSPRFANDFISMSGSTPDSIPDDANGDGVPDYYPTLYFDGEGRKYADPETTKGTIWSPNRLTNEARPYATLRKNNGSVPGATSLYAFPFIYPGMYSVPDANRTTGLGWIHGMLPSSYVVNHSPLLIGDNVASPSGKQTWWGFPTWRETMAGADSGNSGGWTDPCFYPGQNLVNAVQVNGLLPYLSTSPPTTTDANLLPPIYLPGTSTPPDFFDGAGSASFVAAPSGTASPAVPERPNPLWEDDLLQTNVRSFDIKAYDPNAALYSTAGQNGFFVAGYHDLGYGSTYFDTTGDIKNVNDAKGPFNYVGGPYGAGVSTPPADPSINTLWQGRGGEPIGLGHEGRIPPLPSDFRPHPRRGYNIGDDKAAVQRLTRVWDSWSTDYSNAPDFDVFLNQYDPSVSAIYPSFPPPYPSALRGIQIQIRVADPRNERVKSITIRHDFSDKL